MKAQELAEETAPVAVVLQEEQIKLAAVKKDPLARGASLDLDSFDGLQHHVAAGAARSYGDSFENGVRRTVLVTS